MLFPLCYISPDADSSLWWWCPTLQTAYAMVHVVDTQCIFYPKLSNTKVFNKTAIKSLKKSFSTFHWFIKWRNKQIPLYIYFFWGGGRAEKEIFSPQNILLSIYLPPTHKLVIVQPCTLMVKTKKPIQSHVCSNTRAINLGNCRK